MSTRRTVLLSAVVAAVTAALVIPTAASGRSPELISPIIENNYINSAMILNNSITTRDIRNNSIISNDIQNLTILTEDLRNRLVTSDKIELNAVKLENLNAEVMAKVETMIDAKVDAKIAALNIPAGPRAYGRVKADGTVDASVSKNISARMSGNKYCVAVTGVTDPTKITPVVTAVNDSLATFAVLNSTGNLCNANEFSVGTYPNGGGYDNPTDFNVYVP
jgi:hypothetical protein